MNRKSLREKLWERTAVLKSILSLTGSQKRFLRSVWFNVLMSAFAKKKLWLHYFEQKGCTLFCIVLFFERSFFFFFFWAFCVFSSGPTASGPFARYYASVGWQCVGEWVVVDDVWYVRRQCFGRGSGSWRWWVCMVPVCWKMELVFDCGVFHVQEAGQCAGHDHHRWQDRHTHHHQWEGRSREVSQLTRHSTPSLLCGRRPPSSPPHPLK